MSTPPRPRPRPSACRRVSRPSFRRGVVERVFHAARAPNGHTYCPHCGKGLRWRAGEGRKGSWDMGHRRGHEWWRLRDRYLRGELTRAELRDEYNRVEVYQPECPACNRSHRFEQQRQ